LTICNAPAPPVTPDFGIEVEVSGSSHEKCISDKKQNKKPNQKPTMELKMPQKKILLTDLTVYGLVYSLCLLVQVQCSFSSVSVRTPTDRVTAFPAPLLSIFPSLAGKKATMEQVIGHRLGLFK